MVCEKVISVTEEKNLEQHEEDRLLGGWNVISNPGVRVSLIEKVRLNTCGK